MKKSTFVTSTILMRGPRLATHKAGFFCVPAKGISTYKRRLAFTESGSRPGITRASGVVDSGIVRAAFLFAQNVNYTHHVSTPLHAPRAPYLAALPSPTKARTALSHPAGSPAAPIARPARISRLSAALRHSPAFLHHSPSAAHSCAAPHRHVRTSR